MAYWNSYGAFAPYVSVAEKRRIAARKVAALKKKGKICQGVTIEGRTIAATFWGKAWCDNLESYSDFESRLPRGRSYVRNGAVIDLAIDEGLVRALVSGTEVYTVEVEVQALQPSRWKAIVVECGGAIDSLIELLQGRLSQAVMQVVTRRQGGLFPAPEQIKFECSCPDWAGMCKHVAATLYGVGARLDHQPELLFRLRKVDPQNLIQHAPSFPSSSDPLATGNDLGTSDLSKLFGIDIDDSPAVPTRAPERSGRAGSAAKPKVAVLRVKRKTTRRAAKGPHGGRNKAKVHARSV